MSPILIAVLGTVVGLFLGAGLVAWWFLRRAAVPEEKSALQSSEVPRIIDAFRAGVVVLGEHDEVVAANPPAERLGLIKGTRVTVPQVLDFARDVRRDGEDLAVNLDQTKGQQRSLSLQLAVRILPLVGGRVLVVADDRAELLRAHAANRDFLSNATHELKTPIGAISLLAEALMEASDDPDAVQHFTGRIQKESARLTELVQQIITLSTLQGHPGRMASETVPIDHVVADSLDRCRQLATAREVSLTSSGTTELWVQGDQQQLATALTNLVQNAIQYSHRRARVVVTTRSRAEGSDAWVELAVSDNGLGLASDEQERVFERFYRVDAARSRETGGTGLGLTIVREIAEGHGGSVSVWSRLGQGSTFTLRLPAAAAPTDPEEDA